MALDNPDVIELELEEDIYTLRRAGGKVQLVISGRVAHPDITGAKVDRVVGDDAEFGHLTILGRPLGNLNLEQCKVDQKNVDDALSVLSDKMSLWFPPGRVQHVHSLAEFDELKRSGIVVGKFSAEWCGPCKMVAPAIDAMSLKYPDTKFLHVDEGEIKPLFQREKVKAYPTFKIWKNGKLVGEVQGADAGKVESEIKKAGAVATNTTGPVIPDEEVKFVCIRDSIRLEKSEDGVKLIINKKEVASGNKLRVSLNPGTGEISFGRGGGKVWTGGDLDVAAVHQQLEEWFPTKVKHIHSTKEFDDIVSTGVTVGKFSAEWCGPCKAIAADFHNLSNKLEGKVKFLHIDVDELKALSQRESIEAMPTFHFWINGTKRADLMIKGADLSAVTVNLKKIGIEL